MSDRAYQADITARAIAAFNGGAGAVCLQMGTGSGKTHTAAGILARVIARGNQRALFLARLDTLITDTHRRLTEAGIQAGFVQAGRPSDPEAPVQVASMQTLSVRGERPPAKFVVVDECHCSESATVREILDAYPDSAILGLTATPQRGDGRPLGRASGGVFDALVCGPSNRWLTQHGFLVPCTVISPERVAEKGLVQDPVDAYLQHAPGTRAIVFAANVAHAEQLTERFIAASVPSAMIVGDTSRSERARITAELEDGTVRALVGVAVFLEGWDVPCVETVILARAFTVHGGYLQAIGRGLRPSEGKTGCTVIDLRGAFNLHGLPDEDLVWSLEGKAVRRAEKMTALARCKECLAVFRPMVSCPRCGAETKGAPRIPRVLTRAEKAANVSNLPQSERDRRYLGALLSRAYRIGLPGHRAQAWALSKFRAKWKRDPECAR